MWVIRWKFSSEQLSLTTVHNNPQIFSHPLLPFINPSSFSLSSSLSSSSSSTGCVRLALRGLRHLHVLPPSSQPHIHGADHHPDHHLTKAVNFLLQFGDYLYDDDDFENDDDDDDDNDDDDDDDEDDYDYVDFAG